MSADQRTATQSNWSLDLVTVSFSGELTALKLQARSINMFVPKDTFGTIFIVVNENSFRRFKSYFERHILPEYGIHAGSVELVDGRYLAGQKFGKNGWRSQQPLKLLVSRLVAAQHYLILDSKNHFIRSFDQSHMIAPDGRMISHTYPVIEGFVSHYNAACRYFAVPEKGEFRPRVLPTATPFMASRHHAEQLLDMVEERENAPFFDFFINAKIYTEFYFYTVFLSKTPGLFEQLYDIRNKPNVTLFSNDADKPERVKIGIDRLDDLSIRIFGVHRNVFHKSNPDVIKMVAGVWHQFGLITDVSEAEAFMKPGAPYAQRFSRLF